MYSDRVLSNISAPYRVRVRRERASFTFHFSKNPHDERQESFLVVFYPPSKTRSVVAVAPGTQDVDVSEHHGVQDPCLHFRYGVQHPGVTVRKRERANNQAPNSAHDTTTLKKCSNGIL